MKVSIIDTGIFLFLFAALWISCGETPYVQGQFLYEQKCANCHQNTGEGLGNLVPSLIGNEPPTIKDWVCNITYGKSDTVRSESSFLVREMPPFKNLSTTELTNIINYINQSFRPEFKESSIKEIQSMLSDCSPLVR